MKKMCWMCFLFLMSCELIVDVDVPYEDDKIVLNAIQGPEGPWTIELTKAKFILDSKSQGDFPTVNNAEVTLFEEDGSSLPVSPVAPGYYSINKFPEEGRNYRIVAKASGMKDIEAEMTVPKAVKILEVKWDSSEVRKPGPYFIPHQDIPLTVRFTDPGSEKNFYSIVVYMYFVHTYTDPRTNEVRTDSVKTAARTWVTDSSLGREEDFVSRFEDYSFNGRTYAVPVNAQFNVDPGQGLYKLEVVLFTLSEEYYRYEESRELFSETNGDPFAQPVQIYTNVRNGLGIFGGYASDKVYFYRNN